MHAHLKPDRLSAEVVRFAAHALARDKSPRTVEAR